MNQLIKDNICKEFQSNIASTNNCNKIRINYYNEIIIITMTLHLITTMRATVTTATNGL